MKEKSAAAAGEDKKRSTDLLTKYDKTKKEWQLGKTKVGFSSFLSRKKVLNHHYLSFNYIRRLPGTLHFCSAGVYERVSGAASGERQR